MFRLSNRRAQSTAEYAILIGIIIAAAIAMQTYVKRGLQARVYDASNKFTDDLSNDAELKKIGTVNPTLSKQYEPQTLSSQSTQETLTGTGETTTMTEGGAVTRDITRKTTQAAGDYQQQSYTP